MSTQPTLNAFISRQEDEVTTVKRGIKMFNQNNLDLSKEGSKR